MLTILLATCEVTLDISKREGLRLAPEFVSDLERFTERTRAELEVFMDQKPGSD